ncbi:TonB-dependent receptor [Sunxiuqinia sp. A32]|uniref:TonB-dependent receptor n=1 Tax=Sunxiuqinia sp. A32 TaxID=3461496 RepID=UPI0040463EA2
MKKKRNELCCWYSSVPNFFMKMKLLTFLILFSVASVSANSYSQETKFSMNLDNISVRQVLQEIEESSEFIFLYSEKSIDVDRKVSVNVKNRDVNSILDQVFKGTLNYYEIHDRQIAIMSKESSELPNIFDNKANIVQAKNISGRVTDTSGVPLPGVTVVAKGSTQGTVTDNDGKYSISGLSNGDILVYSFVGMKTQEITVGNNLVIDIDLEEETVGLEEVVAVGYGTQRKESVVAAISTINATEIVQSPSSNIGVALAGRLPGLTVLQRSGEPGGEGIELFIRGRSTLNEQKPLLMVDGVERDFNSLDPHEIETISILKDASATAVYGVRGANGVILVTTKRGKVGKPKIDVTGEYSLQAPTRLPDMVSAYDYAKLENQVQGQQGADPIYSEFELERYRTADSTNVFPVRNFMDEFTKDFSPMAKVNVNVSGGTEKMSYFTTVGFQGQKGLFKNEPFDKYNYDAESKNTRVNFRSNFDIELNSSLKMWLNIGGYMDKKNDPYGFDGSNIYGYALAAILSRPNLAYNDLTPDGEVAGSTRYATGGANTTPYGFLNRSGFVLSTINNVTTTLGAEQKLDFITEGLSAKVIASYDAMSVNIQQRHRSYAVYELTSVVGDSLVYSKLGSTNNTPLVDTQAQSFSNLFNIDASINYVKEFGVHEVTGMLLFNRYQRLINIELPYNYIGIVGRATYNYNRKYLAELNFGYNGSEQFAPGKQFGFFPSFSVGWVASEEPFLVDKNAVDFLKIRFSYGQVGNDRMGASRFLYIDDWGTGGGYPGLPAGTYENTMANRDISWEVNNKYNVGIEGRFFDFLSLDLDVFYEKRDNILIREGGTTPVFMFGQTNLPPANYGEVENKGFELSLGYQKQFNDHAMLMARLNGAFNRNRINYVNEVELGEDYAYPTRQTGHRIGEFWGYETDGFFNTQEELDSWYDQTPLGKAPELGDLKYVDQNDDQIIDEKDIVPIGNPNVPEWTFGGALNFIYRQFDVSCMFQGAANRSYFLNGRGTWENAGNFTTWHKESWTQAKLDNGEKITYPRLAPGGSSNLIANDFWIVDGSYIRLKNAEIGYTMPENISRKISASKIRIYLNGFNLLTFDKFPKKYFDPEQANQLSHPLFKVYNVGINITY